MIKANEMRVGNYLRYYSYGNEDIPTEIIKYVKVIEIHDYPVIERDNGQRITLGNDIFKIPLTEEILLKCGFIKEDINKVGYTCNHFYNGSIVHLYKHKGMYLFGKGWETELKFVHQLQNLYFALSGEELEINL